jgi:hypothetical protein
MNTSLLDCRGLEKLTIVDSNNTQQFRPILPLSEADPGCCSGSRNSHFGTKFSRKSAEKSALLSEILI